MYVLLADTDNTEEETIRQCLPQGMKMEQSEPDDNCAGWFQMISDDYNCSYDQEDGPAMYYRLDYEEWSEFTHLLQHYTRHVLKVIKEIHIDIQDDNQRLYNVMFLLYQMSSLLEDSNYLKVVLSQMPEDHTHWQQVRSEIRFNIGRIN